MIGMTNADMEVQQRDFQRNGFPRMKRLIIAFCLLTVNALASVTPNPIMPAERQAAWQGNVGIPGGIPYYPIGINVKNPPFNAYGDGIHNDTTAIQNAINAATNYTAIYLPPGTYIVTNYLNIPNGYMSYPNIALRGAGPRLTTILLSNAPGTIVNDIIFIHHGTQIGAEVPITGGLTQGSQSITLSTAAGIGVGSILSITELNDTNFVSILDYTTNQTIPSGSVYGPALGVGAFPTLGTFTIATTSFIFSNGTGNPFQLSMGADDQVLVNGTAVYSNVTSVMQFVAQGPTVTLYGTPGSSVTAFLGGCIPCGYCGESGQRVLQQYVQVTNVNGNTLGINPPLLFSYNPALAPTAQSYLMISNCGVEDLSVGRMNGTNTSAGANIDISDAAWCWVTNVESFNAQGSHVRLNMAFQCQVSHCYLHDAYSYVSGEGYGVWVYNHNSNHLIEDTIFQDIRHSMVTEAGGAACVFAYNFSTNPIAGENPTDFLSGDELQHGAHGWYILYEGNVSVAARGDYTHGSASHITYFRDDYYGTSYCGPQVHDAYGYTHNPNFSGCWVTNEGGFDAFDFEVYTRSNSVVGCVASPTFLTNPLPRSGVFTPAANFYTDLQPMVLRTGFIDPGSIGYLSDPTVGPTVYYHGNWDFVNQTVVWNSTNTDHTIPSSLYLASKPSWWTAGMAWPPIGPDLNPMVGTVPAVARLQNILSLAPPPNFHVVQ